MNGDNVADAANAVVARAGEIRDAVRMALLEERVADHGSRISSLEAFKWWLLAGVSAGAVGSWLSVLVTLATKGHV